MTVAIITANMREHNLYRGLFYMPNLRIDIPCEPVFLKAALTYLASELRRAQKSVARLEASEQLEATSDTTVQQKEAPKVPAPPNVATKNDIETAQKVFSKPAKLPADIDPNRIVIPVIRDGEPVKPGETAATIDTTSSTGMELEQTIPSADGGTGVTPAVTLEPLTNAVVVDSTGVPWDARIHQKKKTRRKSDDTWTLKRNVDAVLLANVNLELKAAMAGSPADTTASDILAPDTTPAADVGKLPVDGDELFPAFLARLTEKLTDGTYGVGMGVELSLILSKHDIAQAGLLMSRPDLIPQIEIEINAAWERLQA